MANVNSVSSSSSTSSLYGSRNVLSGLASGLDTEALIENSVSSYKTKISGFQQKQEKLEWKQEAYRAITDKMIDLGDKYTSYTSSTNLSSATFYNSAIKTVTSGTYASKVTATGKSDSEVEISAVRQLATSARYAVSGSRFGGSSNAAANSIDWSGSVDTNHIAGSKLTLSYGDGKSVTVEFGEADSFNSMEEFVSALNAKLTDASGEGEAPIAASLDGGKLSFSQNAKLSSTEGGLAGLWSGENATEGESVSYGVKNDFEFHTTESMPQYLAGKTIDVTLDGVTKTISIGSGISDSDALAADLNAKLRDAFGTYGDAGSAKVSVDVSGGKLSFELADGLSSNLSISSDVSEKLGFSSAGLTSYLNGSQKVSELVSDWGGAESKTLTINGTDITVGKDDTLDTMLNKINSSAAGVKVTYSQTANQFVFNSTETGSGTEIRFGGELQRLFSDGEAPTGGTYTKGKDAIVDVTINGSAMTLTRASNTMDIDGLNITVKGEFTTAANEDAVTIKTQTDTEKMVSVIKSFVDDYNAIMKAVHDGYATQPLSKSDGSTYEPLIESDKEDMSDKAIDAYESKAKTGLLFGDSDLSSLYNELRSAISDLGLGDIGLTTEYNSDSKITTLKLDEEKLRSVLDSEPDKVKSAFIGSDGSSGLMNKTKDIVKKYASTSMAGYGVLVKKAGTTKKSVTLLDNTIQKQIDGLDDDISAWTTKMNNQVDYYTKMFSQLEVLMNTMNSQSSMLSGLMGG